MEKKDKKMVNTNLGILLICLFSSIFTLVDFLIVDKILDGYNKCEECTKCGDNNLILDDNKDNTSIIDDKKTDDNNGSEAIDNDKKDVAEDYDSRIISMQRNLKKLEKIVYKNDNITNVELKSERLDDELNVKPIITAYNNGEIVWEYSFGSYNPGRQHSAFDLISVAKNELYLQYDGKFFVMNLDNGNVEEIKFGNEDYHVYEVYYMFEDYGNTYVVGTQSGFSGYDSLVIINKKDRTIRSIINTID